MALSADSMRCGEFRTTYKADTTIFPTPRSRNFALAGLLMLLVTPFIFESYIISLLIQIGYYAIAALGLNILVGSTGQISIGHGAFFGVGAFGSAWLNNSLGIPVILAIPPHQRALPSHRHARRTVHPRGHVQPCGLVHRRSCRLNGL